VDREEVYQSPGSDAVISASLFWRRFASRAKDDSPAMKAVSALRNQFGGHAVKANRPFG